MNGTESGDSKGLKGYTFRLSQESHEYLQSLKVEYSLSREQIVDILIQEMRGDKELELRVLNRAAGRKLGKYIQVVLGGFRE